MQNQRPDNPSLMFYGSRMDLGCQIQDLILVLEKTEKMEFPEHDEHESLIADIHPDITRKSFIVMLLIALDSQLSGFCQLLKNSTNQILSWSELKGSGLERFIAYSEKVCGLSPVCDEKTKQKLIGLIELRNCIVHNESCLDGFSKQPLIKTFASQVDGIAIESGVISLSFEACVACSEIVFEFMSQAYKSALRMFPK